MRPGERSACRVFALYGWLLHRQVKKTLQTGAISLAEVDSLLQRFHLLGHTGSDLGDTLKEKYESTVLDLETLI